MIIGYEKAVLVGWALLSLFLALASTLTSAADAASGMRVVSNLEADCRPDLIQAVVGKLSPTVTVK